MKEALASLPGAEITACMKVLQKRAFALYEHAAVNAERQPGDAERAYADAERAATPLIAEAKALNDERVRRLRLRAHRWRNATIAVAVIGVLAIWWFASVRH